MRILIVTDAWFPQINGVVRTLDSVARELRRRGHDLRLITPEGRPGFPLPSYREIRLTLASPTGIGKEIEAASPNCLHIATEGSLGWAARRACLRARIPFTTSFHTRFAEYAAARLPLPGVASLGWRILRSFHSPSRGVMLPTPSAGRELARRGFDNIRVWTRGVDHDLFRPYDRQRLDLTRPIMVYAGGVAVEKGIKDFLRLKRSGTKLVVGDGPQRHQLEAEFPDAMFVGFRHGEDYARTLAAADVLVFPSRTDTFGLVMLEAMACGTPVAAHNIPSPVDVVEEGITGSLHRDLEIATDNALKLDRDKVSAAARRFTWERTAQTFESWLVPIT